MRTLGRVLGRLVAVVVGYLLASLAAGIALVGVFAGPALVAASAEPAGTMLPQIVYMGGVLGAFVAALAGAPAAVAVVVAEAFAIRSVVFYVLAGGLISALGYTGFTDLSGDEELPAGAPEELISFVIAGLVAGLVYWAVAGRRAGPFAGRRE